tara:strand:- start:2802 stop:3764 length:963 start_codon:yes stop_codon:yes gene_type:complete
MQKINQEKIFLEKSISDFQSLEQRIDDGLVLLEMAAEAEDEASFKEVKSECQAIETLYEDLELKSLLREEVDQNSSYLSINSGAGGTEAQDWADMLFRMYRRWAEKQGYKVEVLALSEGEEAGIKSVTLLIEGPYAYGYLKAETGVHRLVRISPFDSNARRHTSFASVYTWPEVDDTIEIEIKDEDLRVDTYRASGAGGQHINRTDSAVRMTHIPSGIVVQCQTQRSQHANRDKAMKMLKAALYEQEIEKRQKELDAIAGNKLANEWGSQIRSYVLHPYQLVKDHRTDFEVGAPDKVLDGDLNGFIQAFLKERAIRPKEQ